MAAIFSDLRKTGTRDVRDKFLGLLCLDGKEDTGKMKGQAARPAPPHHRWKQAASSSARCL